MPNRDASGSEQENQGPGTTVDETGDDEHGSDNDPDNSSTDTEGTGATVLQTGDDEHGSDNDDSD